MQAQVFDVGGVSREGIEVRLLYSLHLDKKKNVKLSPFQFCTQTCPETHMLWASISNFSFFETHLWFANMLRVTWMLKNLHSPCVHSCFFFWKVYLPALPLYCQSGCPWAEHGPRIDCYSATCPLKAVVGTYTPPALKLLHWKRHSSVSIWTNVSIMKDNLMTKDAKTMICDTFPLLFRA